MIKPESDLRFHEATALTHELLEHLQHTVRKRVLRHFSRHGLLEPHDAEDMLGFYETWKVKSFVTGHTNPRGS
jgi:hypothetical protein